MLLVNSGKNWDERNLALEAKVSNGLVHYVCTTLIDLGAAARDSRNRLVLVDPLRLLKRWAAYNQYDRANKFLEYYTFEKEIDHFVNNLSTLNSQYCLSGLAAAWIVAPYVRPVDVHIYIPSENSAKSLAEALELNPIPRSGNVKFVVPHDEGVFYGAQQIRGLNIVSNVQLYVDLFNFPARGEEAASRLLEVLLKEWQQKRMEPEYVRS